MGPTLWKSLDFADVNQDKGWGYANGKTMYGSHYDMNHEAPWCTGIVWLEENKYFVLDGRYTEKNLILNDFASDHGPGGNDHSVATIKRYSNINLKRGGPYFDGISSHMRISPDKVWLYICDNGNDRVIRVKIGSG